MKNIKIIAAFLVVTFVTSCGEDFLDLTPPDAISDQEAFETFEDFEVALNGAYASLRGGGAYWGKNMMMNFEVATDNLYAISTGFSNQWGTQHAWINQAGTGEGTSLWSAAYQVTTRTSNIINFFPNLDEGDEDERNQILGEAKLLRAMAHFDLVRVFAKPYRQSNPATDLGVPIVTVENLEEKPRATIQDVYDFILSEALEARNLITVNRHRRYLGVDAVNAFLARVYHEMGDWQNAVVYAGNVIDAVSLSSGQQYLDIWRQDGNAGADEIIFVCAVHQSEFSNALNLGSNFVGGNAPTAPNFNWNVDYIPANDLIALYDQDNDIRFEAFFQEDVPIQGMNPITAVIKYYYDNPNFTTRGMNQMKVFRASEAYLIRAEAHARLGDAASANTDLSNLRAARINGYSHTDLSGDNLLNAIFDERRKEMAFEGNRWFDLRSRGVGFARNPNQPGSGGANSLEVTPNDFRWVWPIPQAEMDANSRMVQNTGYAAE